MKNTLYIFLIAGLFLSCKSNTKPAIKDSTNIDKPLDNQTLTLIQKFRPIIRGFWVKSNYVSAICKTKSAYKSSNELGTVASFIIDLEGIKSDSAHIGYSLSNHEGSDFVLHFILGKNSRCLKVNLKDDELSSNFYELGYVMNEKDTTLVLYHYNKNNHLIDSTNYFKVADKASGENDMGWGIQYITNKKLISGNYTTTDSTGAILKINFDNNGKVSGFYNFKKYFINTDFEAEPDNNLDEIGIYESNIGKAIWYPFKINSDTLNLYIPTENADSTSLSLDKLKYKLVRQK
jgi:hypothetical protein